MQVELVWPNQRELLSSHDFASCEAGDAKQDCVSVGSHQTTKSRFFKRWGNKHKKHLVACTFEPYEDDDDDDEEEEATQNDKKENKDQEGLEEVKRRRRRTRGTRHDVRCYSSVFRVVDVSFQPEFHFAWGVARDRFRFSGHVR